MSDVTISGKVAQRQVLTANVTYSDGSIPTVEEVSYQWQSSADGEISVMDANAVQYYLAQLQDFTQEQTIVAYADGNDLADSIDVVYIQKYCAQLIACFLVEE